MHAGLYTLDSTINFTSQILILALVGYHEESVLVCGERQGHGVHMVVSSQRLHTYIHAHANFEYECHDAVLLTLSKQSQRFHFSRNMHHDNDLHVKA